MATAYRDFAELTLRAEKDQDYAVMIRDRSARITLAAVRGGVIDPLTDHLADAVAGEEHNLYVLRGLALSQREWMRIPISRFDDVRLRTLMERSEAGLLLVAAGTESDAVHLGGSNRVLMGFVRDHLTRGGFVTASPWAPGPAHSPVRVMNRAALGGVQIELGSALCHRMLAEPSASRSPHTWRDGDDLLSRFVVATRSALSDYVHHIDTDLERTLDRFEDATRHVHEVIPPSHHNHHHTP